MAVTFSPAVKIAQPVQSHCNPVSGGEGGAPKRDRRNEKGTRKAEAPLIDLSQPGLLRVRHVQALLGNISHQTLYKRMRQGLIPKPDSYDYPLHKEGSRGKAYWHTATIREHLEGMKDKDAEAKHAH